MDEVDVNSLRGQALIDYANKIGVSTERSEDKPAVDAAPPSSSPSPPPVPEVDVNNLHGQALIDYAKKVGVNTEKVREQTGFNGDQGNAGNGNVWGEGYKPITDEDKQTKWSDYSRAIGIGVVGLGEGAAALTEYATRGAVGGETRQRLHQYSEGIQKEMSPTGSRALGSAFIPGKGDVSFWDNMAAGLGLKTAAALPSLAASIIPASLAGRIAIGLGTSTSAAGVVAGAAARGTAGVMNAGDVTSQIYSSLDGMSNEELMQSPKFKSYIDSGMAPADARQKFYQDVAGAAPLLAGAFSVLTAAPEAEMAKTLVGGNTAKKGFLKGFASGFKGEAIQEAGESGTGEVLSQGALQQQGLGQMDWVKVLSQTVEGGVVGGLSGGIVGGAVNTRRPQIFNGEGPDPAQQAALNNQNQQAAGSVRLAPRNIAQAFQNVQNPAPPPPASPPATPMAPPVPPNVAQEVQNAAAASPGTGAPARSAPAVPTAPVPPAGASPAPDGQPTVSETPETIDAQFTQLLDRKRGAVVLNEADMAQLGITPDDLENVYGLDMVEIAGQGAVVFDPEQHSADDIVTALNENRLNDLLGYVQSKEEAGPDAPVVRATDPSGVVTDTAAVSPDLIDEQADVFQERQPNASIDVTTAEDAIGQRQEQNQQPRGPSAEAVAAAKARQAERLAAEREQAELNATSAAPAPKPARAPARKNKTEKTFAAWLKQHGTTPDQLQADIAALYREAGPNSAEWADDYRQAIEEKEALIDRFYEQKPMNDLERRLRAEAYAARAARPAPAEDTKAPPAPPAQDDLFTSPEPPPPDQQTEDEPPTQQTEDEPPAPPAAATATPKAAEALQPRNKRERKRARKTPEQQASEDTRKKEAQEIARDIAEAAERRKAKRRAALAEKLKAGVAPQTASTQTNVTTAPTTEPAPASKPEKRGAIGAYDYDRAKKHAAAANETLAPLQEETPSKDDTSGEGHKARKGKGGAKVKNAEAERDARIEKAFADHPPTKAEEHVEQKDAFRKTDGGGRFIRTKGQAQAVVARFKKMLRAAGKLPGTVHETMTGFTYHLKNVEWAVEQFDSSRVSQSDKFLALNEVIADEIAARNGDFGPAKSRRKGLRTREAQLAEGADAAAIEPDYAKLENALGRPPTGLEKTRYAFYEEMILNRLEENIRADVETNLDELQQFAKDIDPQFAKMFPVGAKREVRDALNENAPKKPAPGIKKVPREKTPETKEDFPKLNAALQITNRRIITVQSEAEALANAKLDAERRAAAYSPIAQSGFERTEAPRPTPKAEIPIWERQTQTKGMAAAKNETLDLRQKLAAVEDELRRARPMTAAAERLKREAAALRRKLTQAPAVPTDLDRTLFSGEKFDDITISEKQAADIESRLAEQAKSAENQQVDFSNYSYGESTALHPDEEFFANSLRNEAAVHQQNTAEKYRGFDEALSRDPTALSERVLAPVETKDGTQLYSDKTGFVPIEESFTVTQLVDSGLRRGSHNPPLMQFVSSLMKQLAGDVKIYLVSDVNYSKIKQGKGSDAFYQPISNMIVIPWSVSHADPQTFNHVVLHEAVHAALSRKLNGNAIAQTQLRALSEYLAHLGVFGPNEYLWTNVHEFLAEVLSRADLQAALRNTPLTPRLAQLMGVEEWRNKSVWRALLDKFSQWLGYKGPPTALDAVLSVTERISNDDISVPPGMGYLHATDYRGYRFSKLGFHSEDDGSLYGEYFSRNVTNDVTPTVSERTSSVWDNAKRFGLKMSFLDHIARSNEGLFVDAKGNDVLSKLVEIAQRKDGMRDRLLEEHFDPVAQGWATLQEKNYEEAGEAAELIQDATIFDAQVGKGANNDYLKKPGLRNVQGRTMAGSLQSRYGRLSAEAQKLIDDTLALFRRVQNEHVRAAIKNRLAEAGITPPNMAAFLKRAVEGNMTPADKALFTRHDRVLKNIEAIRKARVIRGDYAPLVRFGQYGVVTYSKIDDPMGGREIAPGQFEFRARTMKGARAQAEAFTAEMAKQGLPFLKAKQEPVTKGATDFAIVVSIQRRGFYTFDSRAEAKAWLRENGGKFEKASPVQELLDTGMPSSDLTVAQRNSILQSIRNNPHITSDMKTAAEELFTEATAGLMSGNRIQHRHIARRKVLGASTDYARILYQYGRAAAGNLANLRFRPEMNDALAVMAAATKNNYGPDAARKIDVYKEIEHRINDNMLGSEPSRWVQNALAATYLGKLFYPLYSVIQGMQPMMVTLPSLSEKFGPVRSAAALHRAFNDVGGIKTALAGVKNTGKAVSQFNRIKIDSTDTFKSVRANIARASDGALLVKVLDELKERGMMGEGGFDVGFAISRGAGPWGRAWEKVQRIARQAPKAIEDINRAQTAVAAFRLAMSRPGMTVEKATKYAIDEVLKTQGLYRSANQPMPFKNPALRPFAVFKNYALMMTHLIADMSKRAFAGATPQEKREAMRGLMTLGAVQVAMAGALSLPGLELIKLPVILAASLGLSDGWDEWEEKFRKFAENNLGKDLGTILTKGLPHELGISLSSHLSLSDMWVHGQPDKNSMGSLFEFIVSNYLGAPGGTVKDAFEGIDDITKNGDYLKGMGKILPIKFLANAFKSINQYNRGQATEAEVGLNIFGLRSSRQDDRGREIGGSVRRRDALESEQKSLQNRYLSADTPAERARIRVEMIKHNSKSPLKYKVFPTTMEKRRLQNERERVN